MLGVKRSAILPPAGCGFASPVSAPLHRSSPASPNHTCGEVSMPKGPFTDFKVLTPSGRVTSPYAIRILAPGDSISIKAYIDIPPTDVAIELTIAAPLGLQHHTYVVLGTLDATTSPPEAPRFTCRALMSPDSLFATLWDFAFQVPVPPTVADGPFTVVARL